MEYLFRQAIACSSAAILLEFLGYEQALQSGLSEEIAQRFLTPLAPHRYSVSELLHIFYNRSPAVWSSLYQGSPVLLSGNILPADKWRFYGGPGQPALPDLGQFDAIVQTWDGSFKDSTGSDFCAGQVWGCRGAERWMLDYVLERMSYVRFKQAIRQMWYRWPKTSFTLIEDKANGPAVMSDLQGEISGLTAVEPEGGKIARAWKASSDLAGGNVFVPDPSIAPYIGQFIHRCAVFPANINKAGSDDDLDAFTQMVNYMRQMVFGVGDWLKTQQEKLKAEAAGISNVETCIGPGGETLFWDDKAGDWVDPKSGVHYAEAEAET